MGKAKCRHPVREHWMRREPILRTDNRSDFLVRRYCGKCGEWLPLAPSDETDPRVAVEIRAAEIAAHEAGLFGYHGMTVGEWFGWESRKPSQLSDYQVSGYLARAIVEHTSTKAES